jgi:hypothetical protein
MSVKFWMVWGEDSGAPTVKHYEEGTARREAERLARAVGKPFHVLASVASVQRSDVTWEEAAEMMPF